MSEKAFSNTLPKVGADRINSKLSSTKKATIDPKEIYDENYTVEEQEMLRKIFSE